MKLLIADDEDIIRQGLAKLPWDEIGINQIEMTDNGVEALNFISTFQPDIFLTDIRMPGFDGLQLAREIADRGIKCKLILLSGYGLFEYAQKAISVGVFEYLLKPSSPEEILGSVKRAVDELKRDGAIKKMESMQQKKEDVFSGGEESNIKIILDYIEINYMNDISLSTLAEHTHFSPSYVSRLIKKETNYNFTKILGIMRMLKAAELLATTELKIYMICDKIGINDQRYFSQQFRKTFGKTPMEYRKSCAGKHEGGLLEYIHKTSVDSEVPI